MRILLIALMLISIFALGLHECGGPDGSENRLVVELEEGQSARVELLWFDEDGRDPCNGQFVAGWLTSLPAFVRAEVIEPNDPNRFMGLLNPCDGSTVRDVNLAVCYSQWLTASPGYGDAGTYTAIRYARDADTETRGQVVWKVRNSNRPPFMVGAAAR